MLCLLPPGAWFLTADPTGSGPLLKPSTRGSVLASNPSSCLLREAKGFCPTSRLQCQASWVEGGHSSARLGVVSCLFHAVGLTLPLRPLGGHRPSQAGGRGPRRSHRLPAAPLSASSGSGPHFSSCWGSFPQGKPVRRLCLGPLRCEYSALTAPQLALHGLGPFALICGSALWSWASGALCSCPLPSACGAGTLHSGAGWQEGQLGDEEELASVPQKQS